MSLTAGVIAVQGDVPEHARAIERAARAHDETAEVAAIRTAGTVPDCDLLLLPGGESTAISTHLHREEVAAEILAHVAAGKPLLATCAGLIVACADAGDERVETLDLIDATVERNAFGRQRDSFEIDLDVAGLDEPFPAVFIRAPAIAGVESGGSAHDRPGSGDDQAVDTDDPAENDADESGVEVLAAFDGRPVAVRDGPVVGTAFHPELTGDPRLHGLAFFGTASARPNPMQ